jgi:hypothetical protein
VGSHALYRPDIQIVSDIDFTICRPLDTRAPFLAKCLTSTIQACPIFHASGVFPCRNGRCDPPSEKDFHLSMGCPKRDAFSEEFYTWLASLDFENDHPIEHSLSFIQQHTSIPIFLTNRDEQCRTGTLSFFHKNAIDHHALHMRPHRDYRPLWDFKVEKMAELSQQHAHILWIDDQEPPVIFENVVWAHPETLGGIF